MSPTCSRARSTASPSSTATRSAGPSSSRIRAATRRPRCSRWRRWRRRASSTGSSWTRSRASRAPGGAGERHSISRPSTRTSSRTRSRGTATPPSSSRSFGRSAPRGPVTFVPHLLPLDQGLLASCYVDARARDRRRRAARPLPRAATRTSGSSSWWTPRPGVADVRETNFCRIHVALDAEGGRAMAFAAIDNLWKGAAGQAVQNLNLMLGLEESEGLDEPRGRRPHGFFRSRWVEAPEGVEELDPARLAPGFRAGARALRAQGRRRDGRRGPRLRRRTTSPRRSCSHGTLPRPRRCESAATTSITTQSARSRSTPGNANAATGEPGYRDALAMQRGGGRCARGRCRGPSPSRRPG